MPISLIKEHLKPQKRYFNVLIKNSHRRMYTVSVKKGHPYVQPVCDMNIEFMIFHATTLILCDSSLSNFI